MVMQLDPFSMAFIVDRLDMMSRIDSMCIMRITIVQAAAKGGVLF